MNILFTTGCRDCLVLKEELDRAKIEYEECTDVETMKSLGFRSAPMFETSDGRQLTFVEAVRWARTGGM